MPLALRIDALSARRVLLVAFVGWVAVRYARRNLDGETREGAFHALMLAALGAVLVLVQAGSLAVLAGSFVAVGLGLRRWCCSAPSGPKRGGPRPSSRWHGGAGGAAVIGAAVLLWQAFSPPTWPGLRSPQGQACRGRCRRRWCLRCWPRRSRSPPSRCAAG